MNSFIGKIFPLSLLVFALGTSVNAAGPNIKAGMWEWSMTMQMQGMQFSLPPVTYSSCVTKEDFIPQQSAPNQECKTLSSKLTKNGVKWRVECSSDNIKTLSEGNMVYNNTSANGEVKIKTQGMTMLSKLNGVYKGKCHQ